MNEHQLGDAPIEPRHREINFELADDSTVDITEAGEALDAIKAILSRALAKSPSLPDHPYDHHHNTRRT